MAKSGLKPFYLGLVAIALIGGGAIFLARGTGGGATSTIAPALAGDTAVMPGYVLGSDSAALEVEEYADFQCPACRMFNIVTLPDVVERLVKTGRIRWRFKDRPLENHANSLPAHQAAACAGEQGRFWEMQDQLYYGQPDWEFVRNPQKKHREYAQKIGLDMSKYDECMGSNRYLSRLVAEARRATVRGITSTPTFVIGTIKIEGTVGYDQLKALVDSLTALKKP
ncbi:MAG: thioredoxin domain-containing protein [Gemmatimonadetes bacterium]|nr:thioredoxin domain-containing protein [Gemmatimonadota bacterium]